MQLILSCRNSAHLNGCLKHKNKCSFNSKSCSHWETLVIGLFVNLLLCQNTNVIFNQGKGSTLVGGSKAKGRNKAWKPLCGQVNQVILLAINETARWQNDLAPKSFVNVTLDGSAILGLLVMPFCKALLCQMSRHLAIYYPYSRTNWSWKEINWAEFSILDMSVCLRHALLSYQPNCPT